MAGRSRGSVEADILAAFVTWTPQRRRDLMNRLHGADRGCAAHERHVPAEDVPQEQGLLEQEAV